MYEVKNLRSIIKKLMIVHGQLALVIQLFQLDLATKKNKNKKNLVTQPPTSLLRAHNRRLSVYKAYKAHTQYSRLALLVAS